MHTNAIETWLARMHQHAFDSGVPVDWHYHVQIAEPGVLEQRYEVIRDRIFRSSHPLSKTWAFFREFYELCRRGNFNAVHVHGDIMSAPYLIAARLACRAKLIVHVHNGDEAIPVCGAWKKGILREPLRRICLALADKIVGISNHTLHKFLRGRPRRPGQDLVHYYGIDSSPFTAGTSDRGMFRRELSLPEDSRIMLFAGRLVPEKNPLMVLDVLKELLKLDSLATVVFVGSGSEELLLRSQAAEHQLEGKTRFLGWRTDVPDIMCCCDWFILPRPEEPKEGFGIAVVEAQLAGLRLLVSNGIPGDPLLPGSCFRRLSLAEPAATWAKAACSLLDESAPTRIEAAKALARSPMDMDRALADLQRLYQG